MLEALRSKRSVSAVPPRWRIGTPGRNCTHDIRVRSAAFYLLNYRGMMLVPSVGFEPTCSEHSDLNAACLPFHHDDVVSLFSRLPNHGHY